MASAEVEKQPTAEAAPAAETKEDPPKEAAEEEKPAAEEKKAVAPAGPSLSESPKAWLNSLSGPALRKLAFVALQWMHGQLGMDGEVPGAATQEVTAAQFVGHLKDGAGLCKLANAMSPGAVADVKEAKEGEALEAEGARANLDAFRTFAAEKVGVEEADLLKTEKVEKGKGFKGLLSTLIALATKASEKFAKEGLSVETLMSMGVAAFGKNWLNNLLARVFKRGPASVSAKASSNGAAAANGEGAPAAPEKQPPKDDDIPAADADEPVKAQE